MRLFESIVNANHRAVSGDAAAGLHPAEFTDALPVIALTCVDPRLNAIFPNVLGLPGEQFIWLRNAGNLITGPLSSTMRSLALACAVKGGREIAIIGHTDCQVAHTTTMQLLERLKNLGVERHLLPENLNEFFGVSGSERQNVIKACDFARQSPLIGPKIPVHGLMVDIATGKLDWIVNGYEKFSAQIAPPAKTEFSNLGGIGSFKSFDLGVMKFPETKIGEAAAKVQAEIKAVTPVLASVETAAEKIAEFAEKHWPKPPALKMSGKPAVPPPLKPQSSFRRR